MMRKMPDILRIRIGGFVDFRKVIRHCGSHAGLCEAYYPQSDGEGERRSGLESEYARPRWGEIAMDEFPQARSGSVLKLPPKIALLCRPSATDPESSHTHCGSPCGTSNPPCPGPPASGSAAPRKRPLDRRGEDEHRRGRTVIRPAARVFLHAPAEFRKRHDPASSCRCPARLRSFMNAPGIPRRAPDHQPVVLILLVRVGVKPAQRDIIHARLQPARNHLRHHLQLIRQRRRIRIRNGRLIFRGDRQNLLGWKAARRAPCVRGSRAWGCPRWPDRPCWS